MSSLIFVPRNKITVLLAKLLENDVLRVLRGYSMKLRLIMMHYDNVRVFSLRVSSILFSKLYEIVG